MMMTTASVVFAPEDGLVWVGTGQTPTSHGTYECFDLKGERHAPEHGTLHVHDAEAPASRAFDAYRRAYLDLRDRPLRIVVGDREAANTLDTERHISEDFTK